MNIPGFTAEASLSKTNEHYQTIIHAINRRLDTHLLDASSFRRLSRVYPGMDQRLINEPYGLGTSLGLISPNLGSLRRFNTCVLSDFGAAGVFFGASEGGPRYQRFAVADLRSNNTNNRKGGRYLSMYIIIPPHRSGSLY